MTFTVVDCAQRSEAWFAARAGRLTGSVAADMLAVTKAGREAAGRRNLRVRLMLERVMGRPLENGFESWAMRQGRDREPDARLLYEALTGRVVREAGFLRAEEEMVGCSLDGFVGDFEGIVECKCPIPATHLEYLRTGVIPGEYQAQLTHNLWVTGARWADWVSYSPDFPEPLQSRLVRVERDEVLIGRYVDAARVFLAEVAREEAAVRAMMTTGRPD